MDDAALLRGVYKYGIGSWEAIKMDPELGLADKIFLKDKVCNVCEAVMKFIDPFHRDKVE